MRQPLGEGGFGIVYEAYDRHWSIPVALKVLRQPADRDLWRFKREFRTLADVRHPNLVKLHELYVEPACVYFTMDLIRGLGFTSAFRPGLRIERTRRTSSEETVPVAQPLPAATQRSEPLSTSTVPRLGRALCQLAEGLLHLHRSGWIHRDIKPSNLLVTDEDKVVIVDFGLIDARTARGGRTDAAAGTPSYMAPEQASNGEITEATDCWSVGVVMAEALIGSRSRDDVLRAREHTDDEALQRLLQLAGRLLEPEPRNRATLRELLQDLSPMVGQFQHMGSSPSTRPIPFVGRALPRAQLAASVKALEHGEPAWVRVTGGAGVGKSALLERFISDAREDDQVWTFSATCRDREFVPFRAIDALMDQLAVAIRGTPALAAAFADLLDFALVAEAFPVLALSPESPRRRDADVANGLEARKRTFAAWARFMARLASQRRLVLVIDDAQWGDSDSGLLLSSLLEADVPALVIVSSRPEGSECPLLATLDEGMSRHGRKWIDIELTALDEGEATTLTRELLSEAGAEATVRVHSIVAQAGGLPLFVVMLAITPTHLERQFDFEGLVAGKLAFLPDACTDILEAVSLAAIPMREDVLFAAVGDHGRTRGAVTDLDIARLIRRVPHEDLPTVEPFHERVRHVVLHSMSQQRTRSLHERLAHAFLNHDPAGTRPDVLFVHFAGAGDRLNACDYAERAALGAQRALAFDRAHELYRDAAAFSDDSDRKDRLLELSADALLSGGRTKAAAAAFEELARKPHLARRHLVQRKAAEAYLVTGHHEVGLRIWREVAPQFGLRFPSSPARAAAGAVRALATASKLGDHPIDASSWPSPHVRRASGLGSPTCSRTPLGKRPFRHLAQRRGGPALSSPAAHARSSRDGGVFSPCTRRAARKSCPRGRAPWRARSRSARARTSSRYRTRCCRLCHSGGPACRDPDP